MKTIFTKLGYPICVILLIGISIILVQNNFSALEVLLFASLGSIIFMLIGDLAFPLFKKWSPSCKENVGPDIGLFTINYVLLQSHILQIFLAGIAIQFAGGGVGVWPTQLPIVIQLIIALVVSEFGLYWWHRASHEIPILWRFHRIHHNPKRLYWFNATRFHYVDVTILQVCGMMPLLFLGAEDQIIVLVTIFSTVHGYWQHINAEQDQGFLNYFFSGPQLHRWHHNIRQDIANHNYGNNLIIWDHVFGTFLWPRNDEDILNIGVKNDSSINPIDLVVNPFRKN